MSKRWRRIKDMAAKPVKLLKGRCDVAGCERRDIHLHCARCGSLEHVASECTMRDLD